MENITLPCSFLAFFLLLFGFIALMRYMGFRETMALAEKGLVRPERRHSNGKDALRWGIVIAAVGLALTLGLYPLGFVAGPRWPLGLGPWLLLGFVPMFFGLGLILIHLLTREAPHLDEPPAPRPDEPPPLE
jgi:hypothetical protein